MDITHEVAFVVWTSRKFSSRGKQMHRPVSLDGLGVELFGTSRNKESFSVALATLMHDEVFSISSSVPFGGGHKRQKT